jgi:iron-sulfur cluster assembly protein
MLKKCLINYGLNFQKLAVYRNIGSLAKNMKSKHAKSIITVSPDALIRIISMFSLLDKPHPLGIRISINKKGCNGMNYIMKYVINNEDGIKIISKDEIINITEDIKIFVDPSAIFAIIGSVMDWKENELTSEFTFINPNAKGFCGCGGSFNV